MQRLFHWLSDLRDLALGSINEFWAPTALDWIWHLIYLFMNLSRYNDRVVIGLVERFVPFEHALALVVLGEHLLGALNRLLLAEYSEILFKVVMVLQWDLLVTVENFLGPGNWRQSSQTPCLALTIGIGQRCLRALSQRPNLFLKSHWFEVRPLLQALFGLVLVFECLLRFIAFSAADIARISPGY